MRGRKGKAEKGGAWGGEKEGRGIEGMSPAWSSQDLGSTA